MKHTITVEGYAYKIRPVTLMDASFILEVRLEDKERNQYIHEIPNDQLMQEKWIEAYFTRKEDYYFVIENKITGEREGLIGIYDREGNKAEWGRWVIKQGSMGAVESVDLIYKAAFNRIGLEELFCRTVEENRSVVAFHESIHQKTKGRLENFFILNGRTYHAVEQYVDREYYYNQIQEELERKAYKIFVRNMRCAIGEFEFHHIGVATKELEREIFSYKILGYVREGSVFQDLEQGVKGQFLIAKGYGNCENFPRLELLENLPNCITLEFYQKNHIHLYHVAFFVGNIEKAIEIFERSRAKVVSSLKESVYFKKRICFLALANSFLIELIER